MKIMNSYFDVMILLKFSVCIFNESNAIVMTFIFIFQAKVGTRLFLLV